MNFRLILLITTIFSCQAVTAQNKKTAAKFYDAGNFEGALDEYVLLAEKDPQDKLFGYRAAVCYLNTNIDKTRAIPYLEAITRLAGCDPNAWYLLGRAYHFAYEFDKALFAYNTFLSSKGGSEQNIKDAGKQIEYCENAKEMIKFPVKVTFQNLGPQVNSAYPDYYPFVPVDESFLLFNSRRNDGSWERSSGGYYSNIYFSEKKNGKYSSAVPLKELSDLQQDDQIVGLSNNGDIAVIYSGTSSEVGDLYFVLKEDGKFSRKVILDDEINTRYTEIAASISADSNSIYFASDMPGGYGGTDIYITRRLPTGQWSKPQNLGPSVNTIYDEDFPSISPDGHTLYFSSKGHTGMGGYDIFIAEYDDVKNRFLHVRNIGYPVNTPMDDMNFRVSDDLRSGYISALRKDGHGDLDIYQVVFEEAEIPATVVKGFVRFAGSDENLHPQIVVTRDSDGELSGIYLPNRNSSRYVMILLPGKYTMEIELEGHELYSYSFEVKELNEEVYEMNHDIVLKIKE